MTNWKRGHTALVWILSLVLIGTWFWLISLSGEDAIDYRLGIWIADIVLIILLLATIGHGIKGLYSGVLIDRRGKISLSRFQLALWTGLIFAAIAVAGISNTATNEDGWQSAFDLRIPTEIWAAVGISTAALAGSALVKDVKKVGIMTKDRRLQGGQLMPLQPGQKPHFSNMFTGEEEGNSSSVHLGKVQMFFTTIVLVFAYGFVLGDMFWSSTSMLTFPALDESVVALLTFSQTGYLATKAVNAPAPGP